MREKQHLSRGKHALLLSMQGSSCDSWVRAPFTQKSILREAGRHRRRARSAILRHSFEPEPECTATVTTPAQAGAHGAGVYEHVVLGTASDLTIGLPLLGRGAGDENAWVDLHRDLLAAHRSTSCSASRVPFRGEPPRCKSDSTSQAGPEGRALPLLASTPGRCPELRLPCAYPRRSAPVTRSMSLKSSWWRLSSAACPRVDRVGECQPQRQTPTHWRPIGCALATCLVVGSNRLIEDLELRADLEAGRVILRLNGSARVQRHDLDVLVEPFI
jgi:hypothetical protein